MKKYLSFLISLVLLTTFTQAQKLTILHTNDMHSRLVGFAPSSEYSPFSLNDDQTRGGFARLAHLIKERVNENPEETLVLDAGDFLMGTIFHTLEIKEGFQLRLMKKMGTDGRSSVEILPPLMIRFLVIRPSRKGSLPTRTTSTVRLWAA